MCEGHPIIICFYTSICLISCIGILRKCQNLDKQNIKQNQIEDDIQMKR